ncbi:MAG: hypothetical protein K1X83_05595 [Oligoflexia bacterium]|nr:hypothetical protein [Oligoflexia bacterium]
MRRILPSITTHGLRADSNWHTKLGEITRLGIDQCALFVTGVKSTDRPALFSALLAASKHRPFRIPFVHAVSNMAPAEFEFLISNFGTERFNLHPVSEFPLSHALDAELRSRIFIENASPDRALTAADLHGFAGLCVDISHLEEMRLNRLEAFQRFLPALAAFPIGANHISAVRTERAGEAPLSVHLFQDLEDFRYLQQYSAAVFADICALELENPIQEQLDAIKFIEELLAIPSVKAAA